MSFWRDIPLDVRLLRREDSRSLNSKGAHHVCHYCPCCRHILLARVEYH
jgi:hypothetical protein